MLPRLPRASAKHTYHTPPFLQVRSQTGDSDDTAAVLLVTGILDTHRCASEAQVTASHNASLS